MFVKSQVFPVTFGAALFIARVALFTNEGCRVLLASRLITAPEYSTSGRDQLHPIDD